jgi:type I restriction enzyme S subunit
MKNKYPVFKLSDITELITDGKHGDCQDEESSGYFFLSSKDLYDGKLHYDNPRQIKYDDFLETHRRTNLKPGDILLANCGASIGRVGIAQIDDRIYKTTFQKSISVIKADKRFIDNKYLYYFFRGNSTYLVDLGSGTAQPNLLISDLRRITINLPPLPIQKKIAAILSAYDDLIEKNNLRIAILEKMAEEIYREWFIRLRFPGHELVKFNKGIPEGWEYLRIKDFGNVITGKTPSTNVKNYYGGKYPFVKTPDIHGNIFILHTEETLSQQGIDSQKKQTLPKDSICVNCIGALSGSVVLTSTICQTNQQIHSLILNKISHREFLFLSIRNLKEIIHLFGNTGSTMTNLSKGKFENLQLLKPSEIILEIFHKMTYHIFEEIKNLGKQNINLKQTRDRLLTRLISGKLSVEDLDIQFPPSMREELE